MAPGPSGSDLAEGDWNLTVSIKLGLRTKGLVDSGLGIKRGCKRHIINRNLNFSKTVVLQFMLVRMLQNIKLTNF